MQELENHFSFPQQVVNDAVAFLHGHFVEVDDILFEKNKLGRKIVQTQLVKISGKEVSVGVLGESDPRYEVIVASENPIDLGSFELIMDANLNLFQALSQVFGGMCGFSAIEMVVAIRAALAANLALSDTKRLAEIVVEARASVKRGNWVASHHLEAFAKAPLDWRSLGL